MRRRVQAYTGGGLISWCGLRRDLDLAEGLELPGAWDSICESICGRSQHNG